MAESKSAANEDKISRDRLAELLNKDLAREYQAIIAYVAQVLTGAQYMDIAAQLEMPVVTPKPVRTSKNPEDMLGMISITRTRPSAITAIASGNVKRLENTRWRNRFAKSSCRSRIIKSI